MEENGAIGVKGKASRSYDFFLNRYDGIVLSMNRRDVVAAFRAALHSIGYTHRLLASDYSFADFAHQHGTVGIVPLAAFASRPFSYRNACIAVAIRNGLSDGETEVLQYRSLGAPLLFAVSAKGIQLWLFGVEHATPKGPAFPLDRLERVFQQNKAQWNPETLGRIKSSLEVKARDQLDFFDLGLMPMLEGMLQDKLKELLERAFQETAACYESVHGNPPQVAFLFPYLFRFVTAKIFMDRGDAEGWDGLTTARKILGKAEEHSGSGLLAQLPPEFLDARVLEKAWATISTTFHFQNLSVPDLAFVYESSFINDETRRELGIHSTPRGLAEYIVSKLPWGEVPVQDRTVFEPFSGHSIFLACAMDRLGQDLDPALSPKQRHKYFRDKLVGVEKDPLALEVGRLVLTLSDYPNDNSWQLHPHDVFGWSGFDDTLKTASVVLANPPYEAFEADERKRINAVKAYPPAELILRLMRRPPTMLGLVLPQSFLSHPSYQEASRQIAQCYDEVSIVELPRLFRYADNETIALTASGRRDRGTHVSLRYAEVRQDAVDLFLKDFKVSAERTAKKIVNDDRTVFTFWIPPKESLFHRWVDWLKLGQISRIRKGVNWKPRTDGKPRTAPRSDVASDTPKAGFHPGVEKMKGNLSQFRVQLLRFLSLRKQDQDPRTSAHKHQWTAPKVVCNAARFERKSPWRLAAFADAAGLAFTKEYFAIWPEEDISEFALAAILCSPLANVFSYENDLERHNHIGTLECLPVPSRDALGRSGSLHEHGRALHSILAVPQRRDESNTTKIVEALLRLDAAVLDAYQLVARDQRRLLDEFRGWQRPVSVPFTAYFPDSFKDVITLHDFVSIAYDWDTVNERRCDLIEKEVAKQPLSEEEGSELDHLQHLADLLIRLKDPYPLEELDDIVGKLKAEGKWRATI